MRLTRMAQEKSSPQTPNLKNIAVLPEAAAP